jgi:hypothetical protein
MNFFFVLDEHSDSFSESIAVESLDAVKAVFQGAPYSPLGLNWAGATIAREYAIISATLYKELTTHI